jgi:hypothetical protein
MMATLRSRAISSWSQQAAPKEAAGMADGNQGASLRMCHTIRDDDLKELE